jgi:hypothetical protein
MLRSNHCLSKNGNCREETIGRRRSIDQCLSLEQSTLVTALLASAASLALSLKTAQLPDKTANVLIRAGGPERQHHYEWHTG